MGAILSCVVGRDTKTVKGVWDSIKKDKDGAVEKNDFGAAFEADAPLRQLCVDSGLDTDHGFIFEQLDVNDDAKLTYDEFKARTSAMGNLHDIFKAIDSSKGGTISKKELAVELNKNPQLLQMCQIAGLNTDLYIKEQLANTDGKVTWESFRDTFAAQASLLRMFTRMDKNKSGSISKKELAAGLQKETKLLAKLHKSGINTDMYVKEQITDGEKKLDFKTFYSTLHPAGK